MRILPFLFVSVGITSMWGAGCTRPDLDDIEIPEEVLASCVYMNPFSQAEECREYLGSAWTLENTEVDCADQDGTYTGGAGCGYDATLGSCIMNAAGDDIYRIVFPGDDEEKCASTLRGCELFAGGVFEPAAVCGGVDPNVGGIGSGGSVFEPPTLMCVEPVEGEPPGTSDGQVCTWSMISGCTEEGRHFNEYASCDAVLTQRPYWPAEPNQDNLAPVDERLADTAYMEEVAWVKDQVEACGCICCHAASVAPQGASNWDSEAGPIWTDTFYPSGLAMAAGWVDSSALGAYPAAENHGFSRVRAGLPTTDEDRMIRFFEDELSRRGFTREDFADFDPFGGPIYAQTIFEPSACSDGEGVATDGKMTWKGGGARYVYVLRGGSQNPGTPPNLDLPEGTLWRVDVPPTAEPLASGIAYGAIPEGTSQKVPENGAPEGLVDGQEYYIYVLADIGIPITRCLFRYGE